MPEAKEELETAVLETLRNIKDGKRTNRAVIKDVLSRCADFIDFCKFEFGEHITQ